MERRVAGWSSADATRALARNAPTLTGLVHASNAPHIERIGKAGVRRALSNTRRSAPAIDNLGARAYAPILAISALSSADTRRPKPGEGRNQEFTAAHLGPAARQLRDHRRRPPSPFDDSAVAKQASGSGDPADEGGGPDRSIQSRAAVPRPSAWPSPVPPPKAGRTSASSALFPGHRLPQVSANR